jgi:hypothetical protein
MGAEIVFEKQFPLCNKSLILIAGGVKYAMVSFPAPPIAA